MSVKIADGAGINPDVKTSPTGQLITTLYISILSGVYTYASPVFIVQATAHTINTESFYWFLNKTGSGKLFRIKRIVTQTQLGSVLATPTSPRLIYSLMTFVGTPTGTSGTIAKHDSLYPTPNVDIRIVITGLTNTYGATIFHLFPIANNTAVGSSPTSASEYDIDLEDFQIIIREGEGIVFWQPDNGTASDTRRIISVHKQ